MSWAVTLASRRPGHGHGDGDDALPRCPPSHPIAQIYANPTLAPTHPSLAPSGAQIGLQSPTPALRLLP